MTIHAKQKLARISIDLTGPHGNTRHLLDLVHPLLQQLHPMLTSFEPYNGKTAEEIRNEMLDGDYEHLLLVFDKYFGNYVDLYR